MDYTIHHITQFRYSAPIRESAMEVHMQPRREGNQHCLSFELTTNPRARITTTRDYLGNIVHHFDLPTPHDQLLITAQALVSITPQPPPPPLNPDSWHDLDALIADGDYTEMLMPSRFAYPSALLRNLARELDVRRRNDPLTLMREINAALYHTFTYMPHSTKVDSPIDDALQLRQGVCQDYAHIMIALLREVGIPCRYVSGYLYRRKDDPDQVGADATHAWVEALLPQSGWTGFDPTNNMLAGERHIRVAVGRDYSDVPPTRGVYKGRVETELGVAVRVGLADQQPADDELLLVMRKLPGAPSAQIEQSDEHHLPQQQQQMCARSVSPLRKPACAPSLRGRQAHHGLR